MKRVLLLAAVVCLAMSGEALAATYGTATLSTASGSGQNITLTGAPLSGTYAGDYQITVASVDATAQSFGFSDIVGFNEVYCVDFSGSPAAGVYTIMDLQDMTQITATEATDLRRMVQLLGGIGVSGTYTKGEEQAVAWEIVYGDGTLNLSANPLNVTAIGGGTVANAQALATAVLSATAEANVFGLYNSVSQDWGIVSLGGGTQIPEPTTVMYLLGLALVGGPLGYRRFRRR